MLDVVCLQIGDFAILLKSGFRRWDAAVGQVCLNLVLLCYSAALKARIRLVFSTFPSCSQMPVMFYHSVTHGLGFFIC